jgi:hypothetical protein
MMLKFAAKVQIIIDVARGCVFFCKKIQKSCIYPQKCVPLRTFNRVHTRTRKIAISHFCVQGKTQSLNNTNMADILQTIERYRALGIDQQIDYKKFYLYSIITYSTALSFDDNGKQYENYLVGPYEEIKPCNLR